jgi:hypothetical protein
MLGAATRRQVSPSVHWRKLLLKVCPGRKRGKGTDQEVTERPSRYGHRQRVGRPYVSVYATNDTRDEREASGANAVYHDEGHERGDARRRGPYGEQAKRVDGQRKDESGDRADRVAQHPETDPPHRGCEIESG